MSSQNYGMPSNLNHMYNYMNTQQAKPSVSITTSMIDHNYNPYNNFYHPSVPLTTSDNYNYYHSNNGNDYNNSAMTASLNAYLYTPSHRVVNTPVQTKLDENYASKSYYSNNNTSKPNEKQSRTEKAYSYDPYSSLPSISFFKAFINFL